MLTERAKAYSSSCPQAVTHRSTNRARRRVTSFQPKRVTNHATNAITVAPPCEWYRLVSARNRKKSIKPPILALRSSKVIEFGTNRKPVYDFLLVIKSNLGLISHRYRDTASYWPKIANFAYPFHLQPSFGVTPFEFMENLYGSWN